MFNLILNENMKIYRRLRTWILIAILILIVLAAFIIIYYASPKPINFNLWDGALLGEKLSIAALFVAIIIAADSVAGEFSGGTIKLLLIRPASRSKILLSKYISIVVFLVILLILLFVTSILLSGLFFGFKGAAEPFTYIGAGGVSHQISMVSHVFGAYAFESVELLLILTMAFMLSTVFRSSAIAISVSIVALFVGGIIGNIIMPFSWAKYYLFLNTDLSVYMYDKAPIKGMTLSFSIIVLIIYFLIFNVLSWTIFKKRDVAS
ncbi:MAG: family transporter protein [Bacilli bacterium]|nr:family transporter protein [Bacilli bacterium]